MITARFLIDVDCYFAPGTFVKRGTAFDKLRETAGEKSSWKPEDVVVDACFASLFQLPAPEHKLVYYHSILTEACKIAPAAIAPSLGRAIRFLYKHIDRMDEELAHRFLDWFAHHLSNFGFTWKWTEWVDDVGLPDVHPKKAFIVAALDKEIRLSFAQRIKGTLPEPYHVLISDAKEKDIPDFKFSDDSVPFAVNGRELAQLIRKKAEDAEFEAVFTAIRTAAAESGNTMPETNLADVYTTAICWVGSKSLSHVLSVIARCKARLIQIEDKKQIITSVMTYWADHPGVGVNVIEKLLNYQILSAGEVIQWALRDHVARGTALAKSWVFELVWNVVVKVVGRVRHVVSAIRRPGLPEDQMAILNEALERDMNGLRSLLAQIEDLVSSIKDGTQDEMMENSDALNEEERDYVRAWGAKWSKVFDRKLKVEESWVREELARPLPPITMEDQKTNGEATNGIDVHKSEEDNDTNMDNIE